MKLNRFNASSQRYNNDAFSFKLTEYKGNIGKHFLHYYLQFSSRTFCLVDSYPKSLILIVSQSWTKNTTLFIQMIISYEEKKTVIVSVKSSSSNSFETMLNGPYAFVCPNFISSYRPTYWFMMAKKAIQSDKYFWDEFKRNIWKFGRSAVSYRITYK